MDKDGTPGSGGRGAPSSVRSGGSVASCPWRPPGLCLCFLQSVGGRSAKLLALLCPGGLSRCRYMEGSASRRPWARPRRACPLFWCARCRRRRGELTYARQAEWEMSVKRLVRNHAATAEATTFKNAIKTLQELHHFQILRGRAQGLEEVDPVDLDAFLHGGTTAPTRGLQALRWISKNAQLQWTLPELRRVKQPTGDGG